jgi:hypothetical protein
MSGSCARLLVLVAAVVVAVPAASGQDYFEQKKRELAVEAQKVTADANAALEKSRELEKTDAAQAKALLQKNLLAISDSVALDSKQRADLQKRLSDRVREVEATAREQKARNDQAAKAAADKAAREEKDRMEKAKAGTQGKSVYDQAKDRVDGTKKTVDKYEELRYMREKGVTDIALDIDKTSTKMTEERITKYFIEKSEMRKNQKLTKEEVALLKALNSTISVDFNGDKLKDVLQFIQDKTGINIFIDEASMKDAGADYSSEVKFKANKVTVRTVLKKVFADLGLTYVIKEANIQVITPDRTKDYLVTRVYPVQDLIAPFSNLKYDPYAQKAIMAQQAQGLMQMIVNTVEPASWQGIGERGYGTIMYDPARMAIIVRHTAEMHYQLGGGLSSR